MLVQKYAPKSKISAVVKDDAYGHTVALVVESLNDLTDGYSVATVEEGVRLRELGVTKPVWVLTGFCDYTELKAIPKYDLTVCLNNQDQICQIREHSWRGSVIIEVDTGMGRLGFPPEALTEPFWESVRELRVVAVMSHFSSADDQKSSYVETQLRCFDRTTEDLPFQRTIANSGGIFGWPKAHFDWIRPGLALYGVSPFRGFQSEALELVPVMHLESRLIAIRRMKKGQPIGYGGTWVCPEDMIVGIVGCGYGDGYPRSAANHGVARVGPHVLPMIGNISMDSMAVDLRGYPDGSIGERVTLWGRDFPVESVAETAGTIPNDLLVRVTARVPRKPIV